MQLIQLPAQWIVNDLILNSYEIGLVADDLFAVVALPVAADVNVAGLGLLGFGEHRALLGWGG